MKKLLSVLLACLTLTACLYGCGDANYQGADKVLSHDDAVAEMETLLKKVDMFTVDSPTLDIYSDETGADDSLSDLKTFPVTVSGKGQINLEIAAAPELSSEDSPDDWLNVIAARFNKENQKLGGKTVSVSVRKITSGEVLTYMTAKKYSPDLYIPSNSAWGDMLEASGISAEKLTDRLLGNTAGLLIKKDVYDTFLDKYKEATVKNVLEASLNGDLTFAYTNPYTSSTGLNILAAMLKSFDEKNPLSGAAQQKLLEYQKQSPPVAYTTAVLRNMAAKGVVDTMVMEEQAYINTPALSDFVYVPAGIRHDHPVYTFDYVSKAKKQAAKLFLDYCMTEKSQKLGTDKGFNRRDDYVSQDPGLDGAGYLSAQSVWKQNKNGGRPTAAVFIADTSGSMDGTPIKSLKESLLAASSFIGSDNYIGLVSYSNDVTKHLDIKKFDATQRAYFSGEVKAMTANGGTATYNAVLVGMQMLTEAAKEIPDARLMLFVLSDGETNEGWELDRVTPIVAGLQIPVYTISYNYSDNGELETLSSINEAATIKADSDNITNQLRNLFNVET